MFMSAPAALLQSWPHKYRREGLLLVETVLHWLIPEGLQHKGWNLTSGFNVCQSPATFPCKTYFRHKLWELDEIQLRYMSSRKQPVQKGKTVLVCFLLEKSGVIPHQPQGNKEQNLAHWVSLSMDSHPHCSELWHEYSFCIVCVDQEVICIICYYRSNYIRSNSLLRCF